MIKPFDAAAYLVTGEMVAEYLRSAAASGDSVHLDRAFDDVARAFDRLREAGR